MNKIPMKEVERLLKGANCVLIATDKGTGFVGMGSDILTYYTLLTKELSEKCGKDILERSFKRAFKGTDELLDELKELLKDLEKGEK